MANVVVVTSGKGGVGKTTSTAALGAALAQAGQTVVVVDFDIGLRNLDLVMGAERRAVFDLIDVIQGVAKLPQALIRDKPISAASPWQNCFAERLMSGRIEARTGLQMMPTFPQSPLSFRTAGFPQYGWKAGFPSGAFPGR